MIWLKKSILQKLSLLRDRDKKVLCGGQLKLAANGYILVLLEMKVLSLVV